MSIPHFFLDSQIIAQQSEREFILHLSADDLKHAKVLRLKTGEHIAVIDAAKDYFECEICSFDNGQLVVSVTSHFNTEQNFPHVVLAQGIAKGEKMDSVIRQTTELGVHAIVPFMCERSIVKLSPDKINKRMDRWQIIAKSAAMQSGRLYVPEIHLPLEASQAASMFSDALAVVVCWEESDGRHSIGSAIRAALNTPPRASLHDLGSSSSSANNNAGPGYVVVVVGPEGGLTPSEVQFFLDCSQHSAVASMGQTILRTETAGVVATALAIYELGGLGNMQTSTGDAHAI